MDDDRSLAEDCSSRTFAPEPERLFTSARSFRWIVNDPRGDRLEATIGAILFILELSVPYDYNERICGIMELLNTREK